MNIAILFHRWADVSARYRDGSPVVHSRRPDTGLTCQRAVWLRLARSAAWREKGMIWAVCFCAGCSWLFAGPRGGRDPFFERLGTIMAGRERCRSGGMGEVIALVPAHSHTLRRIQSAAS